jgi:hypothetical protein
MSSSAGASGKETQIHPGPEQVSEAVLGRDLTSVLQGGATEMSKEHRPPDETVSGQISRASPAYGTESEVSTMRPREQTLALRVRCSVVTRKERCWVP